MASKEQGRDPKTKWGLAKTQGEAGVKTSVKEMSSNVVDIRAQMQEKEPAEQWLFTKEQLQNTPSRKDKVTVEKELNYRQQAANLIQDMGQRLPVNQLTINTAIVYMHRFYMFHSFQAFSRFVMAPTALFLAAKVEEQPRKLEHVIKVCHSCLHTDKPHLDVHSDNYLKQAQELVKNELIMLQAIGFDISIDHPHTHVVKCTQLVKASRDLSQMAYFMATNSLHLTTFCLKYKPTVVSAMCIHLSCKWSNYEIPLSSTGKAYWTYMDPTITEAMLENIINEFLQILNLCPTRLRKLKNYKPSARDGGGGSTPSSKDGQQSKPNTSRGSHPGGQISQHPTEVRQPVSSQSEQQKKHTASMSLAEYKNKREKELQTKQTHVGGNAGESDNANLVAKQQKITQAAQHGHRTAGPPQHAPQGNSRTSQHVKPGHSHGDRAHTKPTHPAPHSKAPPGLIAGTQAQHIKQEKAGPHAKPPNLSEHHRRTEKPNPGHPHKHPPPQGAQATPSARQHHSGVHAGHKPAPQSGRPHASGKEPQRQVAAVAQHPVKPTPAPPSAKTTQKIKEEAQPTASQNQAPAPELKPVIDEDDLERKIMESMKAEKIETTKTVKLVQATPPTEPAQPSSNHQHNVRSASKDHRSRQDPPSVEPGQAGSHAMPSQEPKSLYEFYKKDPDSLRRHLKRKAVNGPLSEEEKILLHKCKKKDEERQKRKQHKKHKSSHHSQPSDSAKAVEEGRTPPSGGLTVRIKLPPSVRAEMSKGHGSSGAATKVVGSSSGSGSEATTSSPGGTVSKSGRKRAHGHDGAGASDATSAKQSRKSDGHHHQSHHGSHESSKSSKHRHSRSSSHHHHRHHHSKPHQSSQKIENAVFLRALEDAVSMVQSGQASSSSGGEKPAPTVALKLAGAENGSKEAHAAQGKHRSSKRSRQSGFDPTAPISATLPEDLFDGDEEDSKRNGPSTSKPAYLSSPETGEIRDDDDDDMSPLREHVPYSTFELAKDRNLLPQRRANANNNNTLPSHHDQRWSGNGSVPPQPSLMHVSRGYPHSGGDGPRDRERLPPPPPLTVKPGRTMDPR